jgi:hypothetical protein
MTLKPKLGINLHGTHTNLELIITLNAINPFKQLS